MTVIETTLPAPVKAGGIDLAALIKTEDEGLDYITNSEVYGERGLLALVSLILDDSKRATLRGPIVERRTVDEGKGKDFVYAFVGKQMK
ncbi:hypothetical protein HK104_007690, partial [Borealophlyctis nickersoniae]